MKSKLVVIFAMMILTLFLFGCDPQLPEAGREDSRIARTYIQTPFNILNGNVTLADIGDSARYGDSIIMEYPKNPFSRHPVIKHPEAGDEASLDSRPSVPSDSENLQSFIKINLQKEGFHLVVKGSSLGLLGTPVAGLQVDTNCKVSDISIDEYFAKTPGSGGVINGTVVLYDEKQGKTAQVKMKNLQFSFSDTREMVYGKGDIILKPMGSSQEFQVTTSSF